MKTLLLDVDAWDVTLDASGQIATAIGPYSIAQNVANIVRLFTDDAWYDRARGIPHFAIDLAQRPDPAVLRSRVRAAVLQVDGVAEAEVSTELDEDGRVLGGDVRLTLETGEVADVAL